MSDYIMVYPSWEGSLFVECQVSKLIIILQEYALLMNKAVRQTKA